jgi:hypothetical protein
MQVHIYSWRQRQSLVGHSANHEVVALSLPQSDNLRPSDAPPPPSGRRDRLRRLSARSTTSKTSTEATARASLRRSRATEPYSASEAEDLKGAPPQTKPPIVAREQHCSPVTAGLASEVLKPPEHSLMCPWEERKLPVTTEPAMLVLPTLSHSEAFRSSTPGHTDNAMDRSIMHYTNMTRAHTQLTNLHVDQAMGDAFRDLVSLDFLEVNEMTRIKMRCSTINAPCDLTTAEIQQVQSEIGASPPVRVTCNHGMHVQEDHFLLTRSDTRMEPSSLLLPAEARRPPRPSHWPVLHTRSKSADEPRV